MTQRDRNAGPSMRRRGWFLTDVMAGLAITMVIGVFFASFSLAYVRARSLHAIERALTAAALGQIERIRAGAAVESMPPAGVLPDGIALATSTAPGEGSWSGLMKVTVTASGQTPGGRPKTVTLAAYVREANAP